MISRIGAKILGKEPPAKKRRMPTPSKKDGPIQLEKGKYHIVESYEPHRAYKWRAKIMRPAIVGDPSYECQRGTDGSLIRVHPVQAETRAGRRFAIRAWINKDRRKVRLAMSGAMQEKEYDL